MKHVVFVAPFFMTQTVRFLGALVSEPGARVSLVHQESLDRLDAGVRERLAASRRLPDVFDPRALVAGVGALAAETGAAPQRLLGILENLQEILAEARVRLGLPGLDPDRALGFRDKGAMKDRLRSAEVPCAAAAKARSPEEAAAVARELGFPLVAKPPDGAGAKQTFRIPDADALEDALLRWPPH